ncbi:MAG: hypothetical protein ACYC0V_10940 [Armatimonadota bacterium]
MSKKLLVAKMCRILIFICVLINAGFLSVSCEISAPPKDMAAFFHELIGEWIGTVDQYTGKVKADTKYFHAVVKKTSADTYEAIFEYYRLDKKTQAPVKVGVTTMTNKITAEGTATNTINGKGEVFIDPETSKPESHSLTEILNMSPSGKLEGKGSGRISVSGIFLGAGKNGKVSNYTSTWSLQNGELSISERLKVTFRVLFFAKHYEIVDEFKAKKGSDIIGLMKTAGDGIRKDALNTSPNR